MMKKPFVALDFAPAKVDVTPLDGNGMILRCPTPLEDYPDSLSVLLRHWAAEKPDVVFLAEQSVEGNWRKVTYAEALKRTESIAQELLNRGHDTTTPVMVLSDNGVDHGLLSMACMMVGIPVVPVSPAYSLMSADHAKLKHIFDLIRPKSLFIAIGTPFSQALAALDLDGVDVICSSQPPDGTKSIAFEEYQSTPTDNVRNAEALVGPDSVAKILFTSGSTGMPKGVINTQRMLCSNQQAIVQAWPFLEKKPPVIIDWLPWSHTFGGNHNFNMVLRNGGSLYIDNGKPAPGLIEKTVANLGSLSSTIHFNVPRGLDMILPHLESDLVLRETFFKKLDMIFYAGAALPQSIWERLEKLSIDTRGERTRLVSAWGSTETAPMVTTVHFDLERAGVIGLPCAGSELKMVPNGDKLELRIKGPNVTPGYWKAPELTSTAFDEDGYYMIGDAGKLADPNDPTKGVEFDGRVAEDFKLTSGTWVSVGTLRVTAIAAASPAIQDAVVTGHDRNEIGLLVFLNPTFSGEASTHIRTGLQAHNAANPGSSKRIGRVMLMSEPPSIDLGEITDKGYLNQRAILDRRSSLVEALYGNGNDVIVIDETS